MDPKGYLPTAVLDLDTIPLPMDFWISEIMFLETDTRLWIIDTGS
jgi:hypothetical protein